MRELFDELVLPTHVRLPGPTGPASRSRCCSVGLLVTASDTATVPTMSESLVVTIVHEQGGEGWGRGLDSGGPRCS